MPLTGLKDDARTKLTLYMRNGNSFNGLLDAIKKLLVLEQSDSRFEMPFKAFMYKKQHAFTIERDLKFALVYIKDCKAMSEKTYNLVRSVLKTPAPAPERLFSTMNLYN
jgi:hypothetical protein